MQQSLYKEFIIATRMLVNCPNTACPSQKHDANGQALRDCMAATRGIGRNPTAVPGPPKNRYAGDVAADADSDTDDSEVPGVDPVLAFYLLEEGYEPAEVQSAFAELGVGTNPTPPDEYDGLATARFAQKKGDHLASLVQDATDRYETATANSGDPEDAKVVHKMRDVTKGFGHVSTFHDWQNSRGTEWSDYSNTRIVMNVDRRISLETMAAVAPVVAPRVAIRRGVKTCPEGVRPAHWHADLDRIETGCRAAQTLKSMPTTGQAAQRKLSGNARDVQESLQVLVDGSTDYLLVNMGNI